MNVYIDSSVNPQKQTGVGVSALYRNNADPIVRSYSLSSVSSTIAEFQTFLLASQHLLQLFHEQKASLTIFTDCENLVRLLSGERQLSKLTEHPHFKLYSSVHAVYEQLGNPQIVWIKGHDNSAAVQQSIHKQRFSHVDKLARSLLRQSN